MEFVFKMYNCLNNLPEVVCGVSMLMSHLYNQGFQGTHQVGKSNVLPCKSRGMGLAVFTS